MPSNNYIYKMSNAGGMSTITRYADMLAGNAVFVDPAYESIATTTVGAGGASQITFTSIPSTYKHLQLRAIARTGVVATEDDIFIELNGDFGSNYSFHQLLGDGSSAISNGSASNTAAYVMRTAGASATSGVFAINVLDILDYSNTNKNKTFRGLTGLDNNGSGSVRMRSSAWLNTSAITSIVLKPANSTLSQYSSFALYGIKG
jgi:hypothetical protein